MTETAAQALWKNFLGPSPTWYKKTIIAFLVLNPIALQIVGPFVTGWLLIGEFIFTLALALRCYPLQPGGLLAIQAILLGMTSPQMVFEETVANFEVILLLMFMVAGIYFMKELLLFVFTKILLNVRSKVLLSLLFSIVFDRCGCPFRVPRRPDRHSGTDQRGCRLLFGVSQGGFR
jgi:NhaB family Na+:H+ antiporter